MTSGQDNDAVDDALFEMGSFDAQDVAIEAAELEGVRPELPRVSDAKLEALVAASLDAADTSPHSTNRWGRKVQTAQARSWTRWAVATGGAVAAGLLLWQLSTSPGESPTDDAIPVAELRLGGTARTLGDASVVRPYGPGDLFMLEVAFEEEPPMGLKAALVAGDVSGRVTTVALVPRREARSLVFEGEIADLLEPGVWTLSVDVGAVDECGRAESTRCRRFETKIEVLGE